MEQIYLDNAAATPVAEEVISEMKPYIDGEYGNAGALHRFGARARKGIDKARQIIAYEIRKRILAVEIDSPNGESKNKPWETLASHEDLHGMYEQNQIGTVFQ